MKKQNLLFVILICITTNVFGQWTKGVINGTRANITYTRGYGELQVTPRVGYAKTLASFPFKPSKTNSEPEQKTRSFNIYKNKEFGANPLARTPNDNAIAISSNTKADTIVSVSNSQFYIYLPDGTLVGYNELDSFVINAGLTPYIQGGFTNMGDPKVVWDNDIKRFIISFLSFGDNDLNGFVDKVKLYIAVSVTSNPTDGWYINEIVDSNFIPNDHWFDRPELALSNDEIIITAQTSLDNASNADGVVIFGIEKTTAYQGLTSTVYDIQNIQWNGQNIKLLFPVKGAQGNYGPGLYFVQVPEASVSASKDTLRLFDLINDLSNAGTINAYAINIDKYRKSVFAKQPDQKLIGDDDNRITDAIYMQGTANFIQGVFACQSPNNNTASSQVDIFNLNVTTLSVNEKHLFYANKYIFYPSLANFSKNGSNTHDLVVSYLKTDPVNIYPSFSAVGIDINLNNGTELDLKLGTANKTNLRWGDYTGMCRKHDANKPTVWTIGSYCKNSAGDSVWIAEISNTAPNSTKDISTQNEIIEIYPNPTREYINIRPKDILNNTEIRLLSMEGKVLLKQFAKSIKANETYTVTFPRMANGNYILTIKNNKYEIAKKLIIH